MACCCVEGSCGAGADAMFPHFRASPGYIEKCLMYIMGCSHCLQGIPFVVVVEFARRRKVREHTFVLPFAPTHTHTQIAFGAEVNKPAENATPAYSAKPTNPLLFPNYGFIYSR